jgi:ABC-2 type transport system ATP-binding protein
MAQTAILLTDVTKRFGDVTAVDNISLAVQHGEIFAFLGPNGAGKSTTIKMLTTLMHPTKGALELAGHNVVAEPSATRKAFGVVFQDPSLDDELTAYENMEFHAALYNVPPTGLRDKIETLLGLVELKERQTHLVKTFSGGMKRRLEIARGLLHKPEILFLDEPTLGLDAQTRHLLWSYVTKLSQNNGMTIFFTTHYLEEAEMVANRIAIIDHGKIITVGTVDELKKQTKTTTLEEAYLKLTGSGVRDEDVSATDNIRSRIRARRIR